MVRVNPTLSTIERWLDAALSVLAFMLPVSIGVAQPPAYIVSVLALILLFKRRGSGAPVRFPFRTPLLLLLLTLVVTALTGARPSYSLGKLDRFILLAIIWAVPLMCMARGAHGDALLRKLVALFLLGLGLKAGYDAIRVPVMMSMGVSIFDTGNMRDPQIYMTGVCLVTGMVLAGAWSWRYPPVAVGGLLFLFGLLIHFKRGSWLACLGALAVMGVASRRWRPLAAGLLVALAMLALPPVRERIGQLEREFNPEGGGRLLLWTEVAPALIKQYPLGAGWKSLRHEDYLAVNHRVENRLNHLHNNALEVLLEASIVGLAFWVVMMALVIWTFWTACRRAGPGRPDRAGVALGGLGAFCGLMLNGMVEYNFGDKEIFMIMMFFMGMAAALHHLALPEKNAVGLRDEVDSAGSIS